jgi:hemerythrin
MCLMTWDPAFSVDDEDLDRQHMRLVQLVNSLHDAMLAGSPRHAMDRIASDLSMYARFHFRKEEDLLKLHGYPAIDAHIEEHAEFRARLDDFAGALKAGRQAIPEPFLEFMKTWLSRHLAETDAGYACHLNISRAA